MKETEKLELKHLAPYLEHKVLLIYNDCMTEKKIKAYLTGVTTSEIETTYRRKKKGCSGDCISWKANNNVSDLNVKLALRPLSDFKIDSDVFDHCDSDLKTRLIEGLKHYYIDDFPNWFMNFLFAYHFDVFGLIEKGLAIDINTLKQ